MITEPSAWYQFGVGLALDFAIGAIAIIVVAVLMFGFERLKPSGKDDD
jgi:hypothetical protein